MSRMFIRIQPPSSSSSSLTPFSAVAPKYHGFLTNVSKIQIKSQVKKLEAICEDEEYHHHHHHHHESSKLLSFQNIIKSESPLHHHQYHTPRN